MSHRNFTEAEMISARSINVARPNEIEQVCNILGSAFTDDPVMNWICGYPEIYSALFRLEAEALYKKHGHVFINGDRTGAAMWLPSGISHRTPAHWRYLSVAWRIVSTAGFAKLKRAMELTRIFDYHHIEEPHYYLHAVGATYNYQGRGIGSALLKAGLEACDRQGLPAYLESSNIKNNGLYERHGFKILGQTVLPEDGPTIWFMKRDIRKPDEHT